MITRIADAPRIRNAAATRSAILAAARARFVRESYENVGMRDIAADAGVDAALISRYFGSKEELFTEVLNSAKRPETLFAGDVSDFGRRVAQQIVDEPQDCDKLSTIMILLRSVSSPTAIEIVRRAGRERMLDPFVAWIGGPDAALRAQLACSIMMGMAVDRALNADLAQSKEEKAILRTRLAELLQLCVAPVKSPKK